jgi:hypothetical protein
MSTVFSRLRGSVLAGSALFCLVEGTRLALSWPTPCEMMLEAARTDSRVLHALGGSPVRLAHPFWKGDVSDTRADITLPLRGAGEARATLQGVAERAEGVKGNWRLSKAIVSLTNTKDVVDVTISGPVIDLLVQSELAAREE